MQREMASFLLWDMNPSLCLQDPQNWGLIPERSMHAGIWDVWDG